MTPREIKSRMLTEIDKFQLASPHIVYHFGWPDDACVTEPWAYAIHWEWVGAWNKEGRGTECVQFLRDWLTDENIGAALAAHSEDKP